MRRLRLYDTDSNVVYKFTTDQKFHGSKRIKIDGGITIEKCLVDYPALINGKIGVVTMHQPIKTPLYSLDFIPQPFPLTCLLYTSPSPRDKRQSRMPSSA